MDEHFELLDLGADIRACLAAEDRPGAWNGLARLAGHLVEHVRREELGVFRALLDQGDFAEAVLDLEREHLDLDEAISDLDLADPDFDVHVHRLLDELSLHIDKENLGVFPVAVVTLGARGWDVVSSAP